MQHVNYFSAQVTQNIQSKKVLSLAREFYV